MTIYNAFGVPIQPSSVIAPYFAGGALLWTSGLTNTVPAMGGGNVLVRGKVPSATTGQRVLTIPNPTASGNMVALRDELGNAALYNYLVQTVTPGTYPVIGAPGTATLAVSWGILRLLDDPDGSGWGII